MQSPDTSRVAPQRLCPPPGTLSPQFEDLCYSRPEGDSGAKERLAPLLTVPSAQGSLSCAQRLLQASDSDLWQVIY